MTPDVAALLGTLGLPSLLALAFGAGLLLSASPCVYPMIPVTIAAFGARQVSRGRAIGLALAYVAGIAAAYATLGVWAAATGRVFGAALADPRIAGAYALLFGAFAATSFGWLPAIERVLAHTPRWATRIGGASLPGALAMGLVAGIVFAPCVGPFVAGVLAYVASTGDLRLGALLLATVAAGMGAPFVVLAALSSELARLPRVKALPEVARFVLGLVLLTMALYFARLALSPETFRLVAIAVLAVLGLERLVHAHRIRSVAWRATGGVALVVVAGLGTQRFGPVHPAALLPWRSDVEAALADARAAGRFAVVDFTADWCLACQELERVTFRDPEVSQLLATAERIRIDATRMSDTVESLFARFGVLGLPAVVVVGPAGPVVEEARIASFVPPRDAAALLRRAGLRANVPPATDDQPETRGQGEELQ